MGLWVVMLVIFSDEKVPLETRAEQTQYEATSSHQDVLNYCDRLAKLFSTVRLAELGKSEEGRSLPMVILADPPVATPREAHATGKLILFALANIHAGEVDGKEAVLMLARQLGRGEDKELLRDIVFVFVPLFNADGNERLAPGSTNRPGQVGPERVGIRANAQNLDLNRDFVKLESPEVRALVQSLNAWNPHIFIDLHTTNGSYHRYTLTFEGGSCPAGDSGLIQFTRERLLPDVSKSMEKSTGFKSTFYGNFAARRTQWETVPPTPRYGFHYVGLRNRLSILSESYSYAPFMNRVSASRSFVREIAAFAARHRTEIQHMLAHVAKQPKRDCDLVLRHQAKPLGGPMTILGFVEEMRNGRPKPTQTPFDYRVSYMGAAESTLSTKIPSAYAVPSNLKAVIENLHAHGIQMEQAPTSRKCSVEVSKITKITRGRMFQKHQPVSLDIDRRREDIMIPAGTTIISMNQPLGPLAAYLLEPQSTDGLVTWNFFDRELAEGKDFPILRVLNP
jgi:hypothetical protein